MAAVARVLAALAVAAAASLVLLASVPAARVAAPLCAAVPPNWVDQLGLPQCGVVDHVPGSSSRVSSCRWVTPPARHGLEIAAGRISCPGAGACVERRSGAAVSWLGRTVAPVELRCADGRVVTAQLAGAALADKSGRVCAFVRPHDVLNLLRFKVPATWAGKLVVIWALGATTGSGQPIDLQVEDAILPLTGKQFNCVTLLISGSPVS
jgi:hypothetical protein